MVIYFEIDAINVQFNVKAFSRRVSVSSSSNSVQLWAFFFFFRFCHELNVQVFINYITGEFKWQTLKCLNKLLCFTVIGFAISGLYEEHRL